MKIKTTDLIGDPLDWAVAEADGCRTLVRGKRAEVLFPNAPRWVPCPSYSTTGSEVIDLMEREKIGVIRCDDDYGRDAQGFTTSERIPVWAATTGQHGTQTSYEGEYYEPQYEISESDVIYGSTPRIAVCRAFVALKLGDEVEVPDELLEK